jgi:hypothetical protein
MLNVYNTKLLIFLILGLSFISEISGQRTASTIEPPRTADLSFRYTIEKPAFKSGRGPTVIIDEAHNNFHTAVGTYLPFARLLEQDGYVIRRGKSKVSRDSLRRCQIYVIADAQPPAREDDPPSFSKDEVDSLANWVRHGGALLLITDHMPDPSAIEGLAQAFGIEVKNGYVLNNHYAQKETPMVFQRKDGSLVRHPISEARSPEERIRSVATFTGSAFKAGPTFQPLMIIQSDKKLWMPEKLYAINQNTPYITVRGWFQGAVSEFGSGRIAFFSEAAMFTAQIFDQGKLQVGMNHPLAKDNAQLLLNVVHWLSGLI